MRFTNLFTIASIFSLTLTLACGGGGGGTSTPPPPAPVISSFTAAQGSISQGGSTTLTGVFTNGTGSISNGVGNVQSGVAISTGALQATTTFTLSVTGGGGSASATTTVTVIPKTIADLAAPEDRKGEVGGEQGVHGNIIAFLIYDFRFSIGRSQCPPHPQRKPEIIGLQMHY